MTIVSFCGFTFMVAAIAWWKTRGDRMDSADAYFLGGRNLSAWVIAGSIMLTNLSTEQLIGLNGDAFNHTIAVTAWETTAALAMVVMALFFLPRFLKIGLVTLPDFLAKRYDEHTRTIATILFLFSNVLAILPVVLVFGAQGLEGLFDESDNFGLPVGPILFYLLVFAFGPQIQPFLQNLFGISEEIHFLHFLGFVFVLMVILMMTISYFRPPTTVYRAEWSRDVDIRPWRHARTMGLIISLATTTFYVLLAQ